MLLSSAPSGAVRFMRCIAIKPFRRLGRLNAAQVDRLMKGWLALESCRSVLDRRHAPWWLSCPKRRYFRYNKNCYLYFYVSFMKD